MDISRLSRSQRIIFDEGVAIIECARAQERGIDES